MSVFFSKSADTEAIHGKYENTLAGISKEKYPEDQAIRHEKPL